MHSDIAHRSPAQRNDPEERHDIKSHVVQTMYPNTRPKYQAVSRTSRQTSAERGKSEVRPFYAGESEGLEFLFDVCCPDRPIKGQHYAVPAHSYRAKRTYRRQSLPARQLPAPHIQQELLRCFFRYVWPLLPVIDLQTFLNAYIYEPANVSDLLLWSIFFAAANVSLVTI